MEYRPGDLFSMETPARPDIRFYRIPEKKQHNNEKILKQITGTRTVGIRKRTAEIRQEMQKIISALEYYDM